MLSDKVEGKVIVKALIEHFTNEFSKIIVSGQQEASIKHDVIMAWNRFCEDERDGRGKLYSIYDNDDVTEALQIGLTSKEIANIVRNNEKNIASEFFYKDEDNDFVQITYDGFKQRLVGMIEEIAPYVIWCPMVKEYETLWAQYIYPIMDEIVC